MSRDSRVNIIFRESVGMVLTGCYRVPNMETSIGERIRALREERGWSKVELGRRLGIKNGRATVLRWENGDVTPKPETIKRLKELFGVPTEAIDPSGGAYIHTGPRRKSHGIDNNVEPGKIRPSLPTTTPEGLMSNQVQRLKDALSLVPEGRRDFFLHKIKVLAAELLLEEEGAGTLPVKRKRVAGNG